MYIIETYSKNIIFKMDQLTNLSTIGFKVPVSRINNIGLLLTNMIKSKE